MRIVRSGRGEGKTTTLIRKASEEHKFIICANTTRKDYIITQAKRMGIFIYEPMIITQYLKGDYTYEYKKDSKYLKDVSFLIDDLECVLNTIISNIDLVTTSEDIVSLDIINKEIINNRKGNVNAIEEEYDIATFLRFS